MSSKSFLAVAVLVTAAAGALGQQSSEQKSPAGVEDLARAHEALLQGNYDKALHAFKDAEKARHDHCAPCEMGMATAYLLEHDFDRAHRACEKVLQSADTDAQKARAHDLSGILFSNEASRDPKALPRALEEFKQAVETDPQTAVFHFNYGQALLRAKQNAAGNAELNTYLSLDPNGPQARIAQQYLGDPRRASESLLPDFSFNSAQGTAVSPKQLAGKIVVFDFWATWCPPCRASVGELRDLAKKYADRNLVLISVSADEDGDKWRDFVRDKKMSWPQYRDADGHIRELFGVNAFPTYIVADGSGVIRERITGLNPQQSVAGRLRDTLKSMPELGGQAAR